MEWAAIYVSTSMADILDQSLRDTGQVLSICHTMALLIHEKMSDLIHTQKFLFLEYQFDLWFQTRDTFYQFRALPFDLSLAPWVFTKVMVEIQVLVHGMGINLCQYLDGWLIYSIKASRTQAKFSLSVT